VEAFTEILNCFDYEHYHINVLIETVGILRVIPDQNYEVRAPLPHLINVDDLIYIRDIIASAVKLILKVVTQAECEVKFVVNGKELGGEE
jgi:hypothetical protein